jgi:hypothetical protein
MSYSVRKSGNNVYDILEKETNTLIVLKKSEWQARNMCRRLNLGAGFEGFTPSFFANNTRAKPTVQPIPDKILAKKSS